MGSGDELCSINLRIEYNIVDINAYVKNAASPDKLLESKAYELVTERTISTDLDSLLSVDRSQYAEELKQELSVEMAAYNVGVQVLSVVLESIHPPVEVAAIYQQCIGAELDAQRYLYEAEGQAISKVENAKKTAYSAEEAALAAKHKAIAEARASVAEFMASVEADNVNSSAYRYYKYLDAITTAYGNAKLVIVGDGVDTSNIFFGNLLPIQ
jgi:regulator of protease activity HflC (stomatin/prohibitin superfamily)